MPKFQNNGGQHRTCISPCGFIASGSPSEAKGKMRLHCKVCVSCKENGNHVEKGFVKFDGKANPPSAKGWKQTPLDKMNYS